MRVGEDRNLIPTHNINRSTLAFFRNSQPSVFFKQIKIVKSVVFVIIVCL